MQNAVKAGVAKRLSSSASVMLTLLDNVSLLDMSSWPARCQDQSGEQSSAQQHAVEPAQKRRRDMQILAARMSFEDLSVLAQVLRNQWLKVIGDGSPTMHCQSPADACHDCSDAEEMRIPDIRDLASALFLKHECLST